MGICESFSLTSVFPVKCFSPCSVPVWEAACLASQLFGTLHCFSEALRGPLLALMEASLLQNPHGMLPCCPLRLAHTWVGRWDSSRWVAPAELSLSPTPSQTPYHSQSPDPRPCHCRGSQPPAPSSFLSPANALSALQLQGGQGLSQENFDELKPVNDL